MPRLNPTGLVFPPDDRHRRLYAYGAVAPRPPARVERTLSLPRYQRVYRQGDRQACVGFASTWMMSILNRRRYDPLWLWDRAKEADGDPKSNPGDNSPTTLRAAMDVLRTKGHVRVVRGKDRPPARSEGIAENRWAVSVDEVRTAIARGTPVVLGIAWYRAFDTPERRSGAMWIGRGGLAGGVRGGHAICCYRASDRLQAVGLVNTWDGYPPVLLPYDTLTQLFEHGQGEAALVTDRG